MGLAPRTLSHHQRCEDRVQPHPPQGTGEGKALKTPQGHQGFLPKTGTAAIAMPSSGLCSSHSAPHAHHRAEKQLKTSPSPNPQPCCHHLARALKTQAKPQHQLTSSFPSPSASQDRFSMCSFFI